MPMNATTGRFRMRGAVVASGLALALVAVAPNVVAAQTVPHEAHYRVTVDKLRTPGVILNAAGEMAMSVERDCEKWTVQHETRFNANFVGGDRFSIETLYRIHEAIDGSRLDFRATTRLNGNLVVDSKGSARMPRDGSAGSVRLRRPEVRELGLPTGTIFPMAVAHQSIDSLKANKAIGRYVLFDGVGIYHVTDVAAGKPLPLSNKPKGDVELLAVRSWKVESTLFPYGVVDAEPVGIVVTQTQENGIATGFLADYGRLIARGELTSVHRLTEPEC